MSKPTLVVVFGHYDSRGGTTAITIQTPTYDEVVKAISTYDHKCFGLNDEDIADLHPDGYTPGWQDFMYIAELYGDTSQFDPGTDLEQVGSVVFNTRSEWYLESHSAVNYDVATIEMVQSELRSKLLRHGFRPVQLEFIPVVTPYGDEGAGNATAAQAKHIENVEFRTWDDDAFGFLLY